MSPKKSNPAVGHSGGVQKAVLLATANSSENSHTLHILQARHLARRFGLTMESARIVAHFAFAEPRS
jgi:hypothetical protein